MITEAKILKRNPGLDAVRTLAILLAVFSHAVPAHISFQRFSPTGQIINSMLVALGHIGVPIFFILSGYLLLDRTYSDKQAIQRFYRQKVLPMAIAFTAWVLIYDVFLKLLLKRPTGILQVLEDLTFIFRQNGNPNNLGNFMWNAWFMPAILGLYLAIPFISRAIHQFPRRGLWAIYLLVISQTMLIPTINLFLNAAGKVGFSASQLDLSYFGARSATYFFAGYLIRTGAFQKWRTSLLGLFTVITTGLIMYTQYAFQFTDYTRFNGGQLNMPYEYILLLPCAAAIVAWGSRWKIAPIWLRRCFYTTAQLSLGVFLIHRMVQLVIEKLGWFAGMTLTQQTFALWGCLIVISYLLTYLLSKLSFVDRWLLLGR
ncbi:acyltransferase [Loigolactobacillus backii]|uniref:Uncharacterized protein n=1 Tax=Loigolactobacillus backii TaxID=375175 RepID=A0A192H0H3_9LACO|nr:acyltransferase [Loigolactobacillus backii]ANK61742.1 hypothetical protein AYR53_02540 [Loigolactobacillus backii]ANK69063.1 hypothetical protein AYR56_02180 [Loigolactobacillus backii]MDA5388492.1 acyltransferase [Loigolactobacillus backii]MDA5390966.1 acyltransferase [Loigolactobacillus backii]